MSTYLYHKCTEKGAGERRLYTCIINTLRTERVKGEYILKVYTYLYHKRIEKGAGER